MAVDDETVEKVLDAGGTIRQVGPDWLFSEHLYDTEGTLVAYRWASEGLAQIGHWRSEWLLEGEAG